MQAELEIAALRAVEARMSSESAEADLLIRGLMGVYACDFVLTTIPDGMWIPLPAGWQGGISSPLMPGRGELSRSRRGAVAVSIGTLRRIADAS